MKTLRGVPASAGVAIGPAFPFRRLTPRFERQRCADPAVEWARGEAALATAAARLTALAIRARDQGLAQQAAVLQAQALMLDDPELLDAVRTAIEEHALCAEAALSDAAERYAELLEALDDQYLAARAADVRDVARRVLHVLLGLTDAPGANLTQPAIILADDLASSDIAWLDPAFMLGFCTAGGSAASHTAILARELGLPAVAGAGAEILRIPADTPLILDGGEGLLLLDPTPATFAAYEAAGLAAQSRSAEAQAHAHEPAVTRDGWRAAVLANLSSVAGLQAALAAGAEGIGLLRTEFLYFERATAPTEDEQYLAYRAIFDAFGDRSVVLRTLDAGGDKTLPYLRLPPEPNPFLGLRGLRLCLRRPELFRPQLRAALRAGAGRRLKIMFPMVTAVAEVRAARAELENCRRALVAEGLPAAERLEVGIMVEAPAAALIADHLAAEVDFFSIGTNDLTQYTLAADRTNAEVADLASAYHPAVLRLVQGVIVAAHRQGKLVAMCGELAGDPTALPLLLGLGVDELSMAPAVIPLAKQVIRTLDRSALRSLAQGALALSEPDAVRVLVRAAAP
ncbi:MAG: phosphoenolpyruvate--protein phosphotransferase [Chloroflexi bacterium]|nr:phosphoenolpyruvate--protein phosphotransferase [Chloroflexota bacterium]